MAGERNNYKPSWHWRRVRWVRQRWLRFIDESGVNLALVRFYGRAPRGLRVSERMPRNYGSHASIISTLELSGPEAVWTMGGPVDADVFNVYVERVSQGSF